MADPTERSSSLPWGELPLELDRSHVLAVGPVQVTVRRGAKHVDLAWEIPGKPSPPRRSTMIPPPALPWPAAAEGWNRYELEREGERLQVEPVMPDRPLVVRPERVIWIPPDRSARVEVSVPAWVRIRAGALESSPILCEMPTVNLSKTWFGETHSGELCYSIALPPTEAAKPEPAPPHLIACPVEIRNLSPDTLDLRRICLRVPHLSILWRRDGLRAGRTVIRFRGHDRVSEVDYDVDLEKQRDAAERIVEARHPRDRNVVRRTFSNLRSWWEA